MLCLARKISDRSPFIKNIKMQRKNKNVLLVLSWIKQQQQQQKLQKELIRMVSLCEWLQSENVSFWGFLNKNHLVNPIHPWSFFDTWKINRPFLLSNEERENKYYVTFELVYFPGDELNSSSPITKFSDRVKCFQFRFSPIEYYHTSGLRTDIKMFVLGF